MTILVALRYLIKNSQRKLIPDELMHYLKKDDHNKVLYYRVKESEKETVQKSRIDTTDRELILLYDILHKNFTPHFIASVPELSVFERVYNEQITQGEDGSRSAKDKHDISADSVQNPFDETVTYRNKRGPHHGSVLNVAEAHDGNGNGIIIQAELAQNTTSDNELERRFLEQLPENGPSIELQTDGGYGSSELEELEKAKNVIRKSTSLTGKQVDPILVEFDMDEEAKKIIQCSKGYEPTSCAYNENTGIITATMPNNCCSDCPYKDRCKAKVNNKKSRSTVRVKTDSVKRAMHAKKLDSEEYKKAAHDRNASEGIMSVMRRKYGIDHIPVFGLERSTTWVWFSLLSYNAAKYQCYQKWSERQHCAA